jgi:hypothetical protein
VTDPFFECKDRFFLSASLSSGHRGGRRELGMFMPGSMTYSPLIELYSLKRCKWFVGLDLNVGPRAMVEEDASAIASWFEEL